MDNSSVLTQKKSQKHALESIQDKLVIIKKAILQYVPAETIYLFGSYVYGEPHEYSDIDVYVVMSNDFNEDVIKTMGNISRFLFPYKIFNTDLFLVKQKDFLFYREIRSFEETICNEGVILYERS